MPTTFSTQMLAKYQQNWAVFMDRGYQGALQDVRAIKPKKKKLWEITSC